jgi:hypothetical protein
LTRERERERVGSGGAGWSERGDLVAGCLLSSCIASTRVQLEPGGLGLGVVLGYIGLVKVFQFGCLISVFNFKISEMKRRKPD